ncbi:uncharacterized protein [Neodiprion pinetum]|uniref:uncharacterized protein LOC124182127 isoform X1 n=1 Tax=Neodiprion fabricii TaxID=2872261 RepID=UPI001ED90987|nr:uncharacterized protein LOC124182127 isoform X1 [Neodiprion fabricii]XP_046491900.1 uncharacterized protein LOC124223710 isoform X1 [Neodiprion pinetum]
MASAQFKETESTRDVTDVDTDGTAESEIEKKDDHIRISGVQEIFKPRPSNVCCFPLFRSCNREVQLQAHNVFILQLEDLFHNENLTYDTTEANLNLGDISEDEEIWVFDIPKTINPKNFKGQSIKLGKKNNFQVGNELYETCSSASDSKQHLSLVFNTGRRKRPYKTINVKPAGCVQVRQKLSSIVDIDLVSPKKASVPFPKNLKLRHPLFGHDYRDKVISVEK